MGAPAPSSPTLLASPSSTSTPPSSPPSPTDSTARGPLVLRPRLTPTSCTVDTTATLTLTATTATTARGLLMPSPRLMLIPTSCTVDTTAMPTAMDILMLMEDTTTASKL